MVSKCPSALPASEGSQCLEARQDQADNLCCLVLSKARSLDNTVLPSFLNG
jgi:hypothetical protein